MTEGKAKEVQLTDLGQERALKVKNRSRQSIARAVVAPKVKDEEGQDFSSSSPHSPRESGDDDEKPFPCESPKSSRRETRLQGRRRLVAVLESSDKRFGARVVSN